MTTFDLFVAIAIALFLGVLYPRNRNRSLPYFVHADDVQPSLQHAATEKRGLWEVFHTLAKRYGDDPSRSLGGETTDLPML